jgi:adenine-specific DNA-methyltransferase
LPSAENYKLLQDYLVKNGKHKGMRREYDDLRGEYNDLRGKYDDLRGEYDDLRRYFDCRSGDQFSDIWQFKPNLESINHPTVKPVDLMAYIVRLSVRPAGAVLDPFMGSGTTGVACVQLGRKFTGIELDPEYFDIACRRIDEATRQPRLDLGQPEPKPEQLDLMK